MREIYRLYEDTTQKPILYTNIHGTKKYPGITGTAAFYESREGTWVAIHVVGLPIMKEKCVSPFFACHIHEGEQCSGNEEDLLADTKGHYDSTNCSHPMHLGDLVPLYARNGYADMYYLISEIDVRAFARHTLVIHAHRDDFTSQPSGASGEKIACGVIVMNDS
ncbi:MAG: superoxide dismutase family protein [Erysipelotrichales bacterium]|nr:superoxide dismutase family protein [Erysipelotrichales bacterium]